MMMPTASGDNRQIPAGDAGYAMVVVMGIISVLTVITFGGFAMSQQALHEAGVNRQETQAFQAANGALDAAIAHVRINRGGVGSGFTMNFTAAQLGSGSATVTAVPQSAHEILLTSVGRGSDGTTETIRTRLWAMDIYGMNIAASAGFNSAATAGSFNGNASVFGPFYTHGDLRQGDNLGNAIAGGFNWGPIFTYQGTVDVKRGFLKQVNFLYWDPIEGVIPPRYVDAGVQVIPSVPRLNMPKVDEAYLNARYMEATEQSTDNRLGDTTTTNTEWVSVTRTYTGILAPEARPDAYKVIDNNLSMDRSRTATYVIGGPVAFGAAGHDFAWDPGTRTLTVWGTVFIDGPVEFRGGMIRYAGNGIIVANGDVAFIYTDFIPVSPLLPALPPPHVEPQVMLANQKFRDGEVVGIVTPGNIHLGRSSGGNYHGPEAQPTHAGAFFAGNRIWIESRVTVVGSVISEGIEVRGNNNMDLRTSPDFGRVVSGNMPGSGMVVVSMGGWTRQ